MSFSIYMGNVADRSVSPRLNLTCLDGLLDTRRNEGRETGAIRYLERALQMRKSVACIIRRRASKG
jgi:hypothetical protein